MANIKKFRPFVSHSAVDVLSIVLTVVLLGVSMDNLNDRIWNVPLGVLCAIAAIFAMFLRRLYKMWVLASELPGRTTPQKAVGFMLIPVFNCYWSFVAVKGLADDINALFQKNELAGKRMRKDLPVTFFILFSLAVLSQFFESGAVLFFFFFLALLFVMRRLVWDWRQAERLLTGNIDETAQAKNVVVPGMFKNIVSTVGIILMSLLVSGAVFIWFGTSVSSMSSYREKGYKAALRSDLKNAHTAAQAYLMDYPKATIAGESYLTARGWKASSRTVFVSADMTNKKGTIVLKNTFLENKRGYAPGIGSVAADGTLTLPGESPGEK